MYVCSLISEFCGLHNSHPRYWNSLIVSSPLGRIQHLHTFAAATANHYNLVVSFHQVPITGGQRWHDMRGLPNTSTYGQQHNSNIRPWLADTHPSTTWAQHGITSVIWRELLSTRPYAIMYSMTILHGFGAWNEQTFNQAAIAQKYWKAKTVATVIIATSINKSYSSTSALTFNLTHSIFLNTTTSKFCKVTCTETILTT